MDIPIKGQQLSTEELHKNEAIKNFWKKHQEFSTSKETETNNFIKNTKYPVKSISTMPLTIIPKKKVKIAPISPDSMKLDDKVGNFNMPDLLPFTNTNISSNVQNNNSNKIKKQLGNYSNISFLTQSVKEINSQGIIEMNFYKPQLDSIATNLDFLFDPSKNGASIDLLGTKSSSSRRPIDQTFSEIFSSFPDLNI